LIFLRSYWDNFSLRKTGLLTDLLSSLHVAIPFLFFAAVVWFGSLQSARGFLSGRSLLAEASEIFVGEVAPDEKVTTTFRIRNASSLPIRVQGANTSCHCFAFQNLPTTILPSQAKNIRVTLTGASTPGIQRETAHLICDDAASEFELGVTALVHPHQSAVDETRLNGEP